MRENDLCVALPCLLDGMWQDHRFVREVGNHQNYFRRTPLPERLG
ncbi:MAG: hypothetical protein WA354_08130 [Terracidiphilus sp.]